jgi:FKBP-type peptidyl-prolyl cis-trans isomerase SlyD
MEAQNNSAVKITYQLRTQPNGTVVDEANEFNPFTFLMGHHNVLEKFEKEFEGKKAGDEFSFHLTAEDGYGVHNPEAIVELNKQMFADEEGKIQHEIIKIGNVIPLQDNTGNRYQGVITAHQDDNIIVDLNHPMAGKDLFFSVKILEIRKATLEEIDHGHVHENGHHH